jgi:hypothetical protein
MVLHHLPLDLKVIWNIIIMNINNRIKRSDIANFYLHFLFSSSSVYVRHSSFLYHSNKSIFKLYFSFLFRRKTITTLQMKFHVLLLIAMRPSNNSMIYILPKTPTKDMIYDVLTYSFVVFTSHR